MVKNRKTTDPFHHVKEFSKKTRKRFEFSSEKLAIAPNYYVGWIDLMGAGHLMSTSVHKTANFLVRLHMAVNEACVGAKFKGTPLPINDGIFLISASKAELMTVLRDSMATMAQLFVAVPRPHDRFFVRSAVAFGPVYFGNDLKQGIAIKKTRDAIDLERVAFGPPVIEAYLSEKDAPPFGIAVHESARAFAPQGSAPFRMTHWLWWQKQEEIISPKKGISLPDLKNCLLSELIAQFSWMRKSLIFHGVDNKKIDEWEQRSKEYFYLA